MQMELLLLPFVQPWKATEYSKFRPIIVLSFGNDSSLISVEVMCQRLNAPPPFLKPLQIHAEVYLDESRKQHEHKRKDEKV